MQGNQQKLPNQDGSLQFDIIDFTTAWSERFASTDLDVVTSTMAIHHAENKFHVFQQIFRVLKPQGVFVLGDHVAGCSAIGQHLIRRERVLVTLGRGEQVDDAQIRAQIQLDERKQEAEGNHCESVTQYQAYLPSCGFEDIECLWQDYWLAVIFARRPGQP